MSSDHYITYWRFQNIKLNEFLDTGEASSDVEKTMEKIGISFWNVQGEFRSFEEVINELSEKWDSLTETEKRAVSQAMAG